MIILFIFWFFLCEGNQKIHELTDDGYTYLRIEMMDHDCVWKYADYSTFYVESGSSKYRLHINGYSGNSGIVPLFSLLFPSQMILITVQIPVKLLYTK